MTADLRQLGITSYLNLGAEDIAKAGDKRKKKDKTRTPKSGCLPPRNVIDEIERGGLGLVSWKK